MLWEVLHKSLVYLVYLICPSSLPPSAADHTGVVNAVRFGKNAAFLVSAGMDRTLKFFGP